MSAPTVPSEKERMDLTIKIVDTVQMTCGFRAALDALRKYESHVYRAAVLDCARKADEEADELLERHQMLNATHSRLLREFAAKLREEAK